MWIYHYYNYIKSRAGTEDYINSGVQATAPGSRRPGVELDLRSWVGPLL
jgi:hypothetical protein